MRVNICTLYFFKSFKLVYYFLQLRLHRFPGKLKKPDDRARWIKAINRADPKQLWKLLEPTPAHVVCSEHFVDGAPSVANPDPSIFPISKKHKRAESDPTARKARAVARDGKKATIVRETHHEEPVPDADVEENKERKQHPAVTVETLKFLIVILLGIIRKVKQENLTLKQKLKLHKCVKKPIMERPLHDAILSTDSDTLFFTGLRTKSLFNKYCDYIFPYVSRRWLGAARTKTEPIAKRCLFSPKKRGPMRQLCPQQEFLLTLMRLRLGLTHQDLAKRFGISTTLASRIFHSWLGAMAKTIGCLVRWFPKENIHATMPDRFRRLPDLRAILDCTEIFIDTPKDPTLQNLTWSSYKHHNTAKLLIAVTPNSQISFISEMYGGKTSDKEITLDSGLLNLLDTNDMILVDKGFQIKNECNERNIQLNIPAGLRGKVQMTKVAVERTKRVATLRILVEQVIGRLRRFKILNNISVTEIPSLRKIVCVCAGMCNMMEPIYKD